MNKIDPGLRISRQMIREQASGKAPDDRESELDPLVERIAAEFRRGTISPVMVSGYLRIGEFIGLAAIGLSIMVSYIGLGLLWQYVLAITAGCTVFVALNEGIGGYAIRALRKPMKWFPRVAFAWSDGWALSSNWGRASIPC